ncbi:PRK06851 family protein [Halonatronum saccharophilum]|uniref:PRK06851 family protein n=1 Tax=Halonatronum saccharophilum TaxID=150060 RepID=UPI0004839DF0|nr:PRK06851 family protein [Halonatronum saccharophilum]
MGRVKNYFPGGNTSKGFHSFYEYLPYECDRIFVIKGGPGTGKSTFMKRMGEDLIERGYGVEMHWCSSDKDSLDGLAIPDLKVAFLDGTSPHMIDPQYPGAIDEIINLGRYWDRKKLENKKDKIVALSKGVWNAFNKAYAYLDEAKLIHDRWEEYYLEAMDFQMANMKTDYLIKDIISLIRVPYRRGVFRREDFADEMGKERHLFASAFTPQGVINYFDELTEDLRFRYIIKGRPGTGKSTLMKKVAQAVREKGLDVQYFHCSFDPDSLDMIIVDDLGVAILDGTSPHIIDPSREGDIVVDMVECLDIDTIESHKEEIKEVEGYYKQVISKALSYIQEAKSLHDELEEFYVEAMDFDEVEERRRSIVDKLLG